MSLKINRCLLVITEICHNMDRSSGSPILEELLMFTPNCGNSSSSIGKGFLKFYVSHSFDLYYLSAFYLFISHFVFVTKRK